MRNAFASEITELAKGNPRITLLPGDIGNRLFNEFKSLFPDRSRYDRDGRGNGHMRTPARHLYDNTF